MRPVLNVSLSGLLLAAACVSVAGLTPGPMPAFDSAFTLAPGETATVGDVKVVVTFERVLGDSRCPRDVQCIQAGDAKVRVLVTPPEASRTPLELKTLPPDAATAVAGSVRVTLTDLQPVPLAGRPPRAADYRLTLVVSKRG